MASKKKLPAITGPGLKKEGEARRKALAEKTVNAA